MTELLKKSFTIAVSLLLLLPLLCLPGAADEAELISDFNTLMSAVSEAKDGDTIFVGDVDFSPLSPDVANSMMFITVDKSIIFKSGKDEAAIFTNAGFVLSGSKIPGKKIDVFFENIVFDGKTDASALTEKDFQYPWSEAEQTYTYNAPLKAQQALSFRGNVDAKFENCVFKNYMHENGPVIDIRYNDYTDNSYLLDIFGDHSGCAVNLDFYTCRFENNTALYDGGAIFIDSNKNVSLSAENCVFYGNRSTIGEFSRGGGVIYANGAELYFTGCVFEKNIANNVFEDSILGDYDTHKGGAILMESCKLSMIKTTVSENRASMGGGLSMTNTKADIDGCRFIKNRAESFTVNPNSMTGPGSNMAQGGAIYVEGNSNDTVYLINSEIKDNSAFIAYGGICGYYSPHEDPSFGTYLLKLNLCTYEGNMVDESYDYSVNDMYPWISHPGDMFANPHLSMFGCYVTDETFKSDFTREELPTAENSWNYISATANEEMRLFSIPSADADKAVGERYNSRLESVHIGSNYSASLYENASEPDNTGNDNPENNASVLWWILGGTLVLIIIGGCIAFIIHRKAYLQTKIIPIESETTAEVSDKRVEGTKQIVMTRYDDSEIDRFISIVPETQLLTGRELEVLREILRGKKQSEVAHYLGIEVSTVKDFYKKIYTKLDVNNKDCLFLKASEVLKS